MSNLNWLPLADYSAKYKVSVSTLRRRIKSDSIEFKFEAGKYLLADQPIQTHVSYRPSQLSTTSNEEPSPQGLGEQPGESPSISDEPILTTAQTLLAEIKQAYRQILAEKEEQIMQLKDQNNDLRTLIKVLESETERLGRAVQANKAPRFDL